jgi:DNA-binding Xre family transcriptional regulator
MILEAVNKAMAQSGKTRADIGRATGIDPAVLHRLVHGGTCSIPTLDRLCKYLGLELRPRRRKER